MNRLAGKRERLGMIAMVALALIAGSAMGGSVSSDAEDFYALGEPRGGNSWSQDFRFWRLAHKPGITQFQFRIIPLDSPQQVFKPTAPFAALPGAGWSDGGNTGDTAWFSGSGATGSGLLGLTEHYDFALTFEHGDGDNPPDFVLQMQAYAGDQRVKNREFWWHTTDGYWETRSFLWWQWEEWVEPHTEWTCIDPQTGKGFPSGHCGAGVPCWPLDEPIELGNGEPPVPEPITAFGVFAAMAGLGTYLRRTGRLGMK